MKQSAFSIGTVLLTLAVVIGFLTVPATASVVIDYETDYDGMEGENEQAVKVNVTVEPEVVTDNLAVTIVPSDDVVVDTDTYNSPQPAVDQPNENRFEVEQINPGETIFITFEAYPKSLQNSEIDIARVIITSDQLEGTESETVDADISTNPLLELGSAEEQLSELESEKDEEISELESEIQGLEQEVEGLEQWQFLGPLLAGAGVVVAVGGIGGAYIWRKRSIEDERDRTLAELESMHRSINRLEGEEHQTYEDGRDDAKSEVNETVDDLAERWNRERDKSPKLRDETDGSVRDIGDADEDSESEELDEDLPDLDD